MFGIELCARLRDLSTMFPFVATTQVFLLKALKCVRYTG